MGEQNCGCVLDVELFEGFWALLVRNQEILDVWELAKERDGLDEVFLEFAGRLVPLCVEDKDEEFAEVVEEGAIDDLVGLELGDLAHLVLFILYEYEK